MKLSKSSTGVPHFVEKNYSRITSATADPGLEIEGALSVLAKLEVGFAGRHVGLFSAD
jgi:hypothetical protein